MRRTVLCALLAVLASAAAADTPRLARDASVLPEGAEVTAATLDRLGEILREHYLGCGEISMIRLDRRDRIESVSCRDPWSGHLCRYSVLAGTTPVCQNGPRTCKEKCGEPLGEDTITIPDEPALASATAADTPRLARDASVLPEGAEVTAATLDRLGEILREHYLGCGEISMIRLDRRDRIESVSCRDPWSGHLCRYSVLAGTTPVCQNGPRTCMEECGEPLGEDTITIPDELMRELFKESNP